MIDSFSQHGITNPRHEREMNPPSIYSYLPQFDAATYNTWVPTLKSLKVGVPDVWHEVAFGVWILAGTPTDISGCTKAFAFLRDSCIDRRTAMAVIEAVLKEQAPIRLAFAEILEHRATAASNIRTPLGWRLLRNPYFPAAYEIWANNGRTRKIDRIIESLERGGRDPKTLVPRKPDLLSAAAQLSLHEVLEASLPMDIRHIAGVTASALLILRLRNHEFWNAERLAVTVLGADNPATSGSIYPLRHALQWLAQQGVVAKKGAFFEILRTGRSEFSQRILSLVR